MARKPPKKRKPPGWTIDFQNDPLYPFGGFSKPSVKDTSTVVMAPNMPDDSDDQPPTRKESLGSLKRRYR